MFLDSGFYSSTFLSPVTGRLSEIAQIPDIPENWVITGDVDEKPIVRDISEIVGNKNLTHNKLFIGDKDDLAAEEDNIDMIHLPDLGVVQVKDVELPAGQIYRGTASGRPERSNALSEAIADIIALNAKFLAGNFIMGSSLVKPAWPQAQFLDSLDDGMLKKTGSKVEHAVAGTDYFDLTEELDPAVKICAITDQGKFLKRSGITIRENNRVTDVESMHLNILQAEGAITSNDMVFGTNNIGTRMVEIYDYNNGAGRLTKSFNLKGPQIFTENITYVMPETAGSTNQVLTDIGPVPGGTDRKFGFRAAPSSDAKYILQQPSEGLENAQALSELGNGLVKNFTETGILTIASGGRTPVTNDYVRPVDLQEQAAETLEQANAFATATAAETEAAAVVLFKEYFTAQMVPFLPAGLLPPQPVPVGVQISTAIAASTATATAAATSAAESIVDNLSLELTGNVKAEGVIKGNKIDASVMFVISNNIPVDDMKYVGQVCYLSS